jgi:hypothetical protein
MLVIEIALGVLIGLLAFVFLYKKYEAKKIKNEQIQAEFVESIRRYKADLEFKIGFRFNGYLNVFKDRLLTLEDDKSISFQDAGVIELQLFMKHSGELKDMMRGEYEKNLSEDKNLTDVAKHNIRGEIFSLLTSILNNTQLNAMKLFEEKILELANNKFDIVASNYSTGTTDSASHASN